MDVMITQSTNKLFEKIANMVLLQVPHKDIANVMGVGEQVIQQVLHREDFNTILEGIEKQNKQIAEINDDWDTIESKALQVIRDNLNWTGDVDFALRVAGLANRATRRNRADQNSPLQAQVAPRINIILSGGFVKKMQTIDGDVVETPPDDEASDPTVNGGERENSALGGTRADSPVLPISSLKEKKYDDFLTPKTIKEIFVLDEGTEAEQVAHIFDNQFDQLIDDD